MTASKKISKVATLADLKKAREVEAAGPSGLVYRIRPMNMERYALAGGLPASLRQIASRGAAAVDELLNGDSEAINERGEEMKNYLDGLVRQVVVAPSLEGFDLEELHPADYRWLVGIAMGDVDRDGEGRRLWGREPLSTWATFCDFHGCAEDCASCVRMVDALAHT